MRISYLVVKIFMVMPIFVMAAGKNAAKPEAKDCAAYLEPMITIDLKKEAFSGLTPAGKKAFQAEAEKLKNNFDKFGQNFLNMGAAADGIVLTALSGQNMMLLGPGGGAKTGLVRWWLGHDLWSDQIHEQSSPDQLFGGVTKEGIESGTLDVNYRFSIVNARYALLDEVSNGNPAFLAATLGITNPDERSFRNQGKEVEAKNLRAIFVTGNSTRYGLIENWKATGMASGPAFLNRFATKAHLSNWVSQLYLKQINIHKANIRKWKSWLSIGDDDAKERARENLKSVKAEAVNFGLIAEVGENIFVGNNAYWDALSTLADTFRARLAETMVTIEKEAESSVGDGEKRRPLIPPNEMSTRSVAGVLDSIIKQSALLDIIKFGNLEAILKLNRPLTLDVLSIWRAHHSLVTIHSGLSPLLAFDKDNKIRIDFNVAEDQGRYKALSEEAVKRESTTLIEQQEIEHDFVVQKLFEEALSNTFLDAKDSAAAVAKIKALLSGNSKASEDGIQVDVEAYILSLKAKAGLTLAQ